MMRESRESTRRQWLCTAGLALLSLFAAGAMSCGGDKGGEAMADAKIKCADCPMRARYDRNPKSITSRIWKWHISWCPGWKDYLKSLSAGERARIIEQYK